MRSLGSVGAGSGYRFREPESDTSAGRDHRRARPAAGDPLRQRPGTDQPSLPGLGAGVEDRLRHIQTGKPTQNAHVESFHGRLREECLRVSWFVNLFDARRKVADWKIGRRNTTNNGHIAASATERQQSGRTISAPESDAKSARVRGAVNQQ